MFGADDRPASVHDAVRLSLVPSDRAGARNGAAHPREYESLASHRAYLFGSFRLLREGIQFDGTPRRKKAHSMLEWFLLNPGRVVSTDELIDLFWPEGSPEKGLGNLHVTMHCLRRTLEPNLGPRQDSAFITRHSSNFYSFEGGAEWWTDVADVDLLFNLAQRSDADGYRKEASFYYRRVAAYCRQGLLIGDSCDDWLHPYRDRYRQVHIQSLMRLMHHDGESGDDVELIDHAYEMLAIDRWNEVANEVVIESLLASRNVAAATRHLDDFCRALRSELGMRPRQAFLALRERVDAAGRARSLPAAVGG